MSVGTYLELYLTVFGWTMYGELWEIMNETSLAYLPFIAMLVRNIVGPYRSQEAKDASITSLRRIEVDVVAMLTVIVLATQPYLDVNVNNLSYTRACTTSASTVTGGNTGKTYDAEFTQMTLGGGTARVPVWWYAVLAFTGGFSDAAILAIPCTTDIRAMKYGIENSRIEDP